MRRTLLFVLVLLCFPLYSHAQAWSGIISSSRAINWSNAGIPGGIPNRTTQCGPTIAPYGSASSPASPATINNAIQACASGDYVSLGTGTFYLSSAVALASNVTLRGQGADKTFLVFSGTSDPNGMGETVALEGANNGPGWENNVCDWTGGYAPGTTVITLANCGSTTPSAGSLANLKVGSILILDQLGESADTGTIWNCVVAGLCSGDGQGGEARTDGPCNGTTCTRSQEQGVVVTAINGNQVTISRGLYMPNWRSSQKPQAWFANSYLTRAGVEDFSITGAQGGIGIMNCYECWVKGVASSYAGRSHVEMLLASHAVVRDSYFYQNASHYTVSYGIELFGAWDSLVENNIFQQVTDSTPSCTGACEGNVLDYNFGVDTQFVTPDWFQPSFYLHASGDAFNLWEGNEGTGYSADDVHGTHHFETLFRNYFPGWQSSCDGVPCTAQTVPVNLAAGSRYFNLIGNVLGESGYHNTYQCVALSTANCSVGYSTTGQDTMIYNLGYIVGSYTITGFCLSTSCTTTGSYDPQVSAYLFRWGNWDTVTNAVRWCGNSQDPGWSTTCGNSSEVPTGLAQYANPVPNSTSLPASFYYSSKPGWWPSGISWPTIGPGVTGGNISGTGGYASMNPAMNCFINVMHGPADGSGGALSFNANNCYTAVAQPPDPPTNLTATPQ